MINNQSVIQAKISETYDHKISVQKEIDTLLNKLLSLESQVESDKLIIEILLGRLNKEIGPKSCPFCNNELKLDLGNSYTCSSCIQLPNMLKCEVYGDHAYILGISYNDKQYNVSVANFTNIIRLQDVTNFSLSIDIPYEPQVNPYPITPSNCLDKLQTYLLFS